MLEDGDSRFIGLDMRRDPASVAPGYYTIGEHVSCEDGTVRSRPGNLPVAWANTTAIPDNDYDYIVNEAHPDVIDMVQYYDPNKSSKYLMLATNTTAILARPGTNAITLAYPFGYTPAANARLIQAYDKMFLFGGKNKRPIMWEGDIATGWVYADEGTVSGGKVKFPNTAVGCYHKNRLWVKGEDPNQVYPSDILEYTDFYAGNEFYVNQGDADEILALVGYTDNRIICFKGNSMYSLDNLTGDLTQNAEINLISDNIGIVAAKSAQVLGSKVIWLARKGVYMAQLAYDQRLTPDTIPLSEPIQPIIDRINWSYAYKAVSAIHNERYYVSVPLDDATSNSAVLIYNLKNEAWESVDTYDDFTFSALDADDNYTENQGPQVMVPFPAFNRELLVTVTLAGCMQLYRWCVNKRDVVAEVTDDVTAWLAANASTGAAYPSVIYHNQRSVPMVIQTRGYMGGTLTTKQGVFFDFTVDTFAPSLSAYVTTAGPGEVETLFAGQTKDNTKRLDYVNSGTTSVVTNETNNHASPYMEDYAITGLAATLTPLGPVFNEFDFWFGDGANIDDVYLEKMQEFHERYRVYKQCRAPRLKLTNTQGGVSLKAVRVEEYERRKPRRREV